MCPHKMYPTTKCIHTKCILTKYILHKIYPTQNISGNKIYPCNADVDCVKYRPIGENKQHDNCTDIYSNNCVINSNVVFTSLTGSGSACCLLVAPMGSVEGSRAELSRVLLDTGCQYWCSTVNWS